MDGRLDALRALGKTALIQSSKLKERDGELILVEQKLRRTRRDIKGLKRENKKVGEERTYLKKRLEELEACRVGLEDDLKNFWMPVLRMGVGMRRGAAVINREEEGGGGGVVDRGESEVSPREREPCNRTLCV